MDTGYFELLAYDGIERSVEEAYRAYLDAELVQLAAAHSMREEKEYWEAVRGFRKAMLDPGTRDEYPDKMRVTGLSQQKAQEIEDARRSKTYELRFLYWFDIRAQFWVSDGAAAHDLSQLVESKSLLWIYQEIRSLKDRLYALSDRSFAESKPARAPIGSSGSLAPREGRSRSKFALQIGALEQVLNRGKPSAARKDTAKKVPT